MVQAGNTIPEMNQQISPFPGGIGGAMANAEQYPSPQASQAHVKELGDSFHRTAPISAPRLDSFQMIKVIGKGSFGKVFLVREKRTKEMFALKVLKKDNIIKRNQVEHTKTERSVLGYVSHPFIVGLNMAFQSNDKLYFVLDYCAGGELFFHLGKVGKFTEHRACFYAAEITLAIDYVHALDIVYRDLKPENVLLDSRGHVRLTDFGLSKEGISKSSSGANSFCGTPEYLAPEILNRQGHGRAVDWWSLGALLYEMLTGLPPFYCRDREKLFEKIRKGTLEYPKYLSPRAHQILRGLLTKDPHRRLGSGPNDAGDIKAQDFFADLNWDKLMKGEIPPPWDPQIHGSLDTSQFDLEFTSMPLHSPGAHQGGGTSTDNVFEGFTFTDRSFVRPVSKPTTFEV
jgi:RAC serine/threonine-protein kinase